ncbi:YdcF family protein [Albitalea terrae]|uniref:YdcF family protein n=1 Tax=Piscinibacter terrae TaxID=2496871 RepID=A0A3N7HTY2_9BURK|nr:YdcF family protein [Albitalea terrae]
MATHRTQPNSRERHVNSLFTLLGIETWKPVLAALLLPPVPFLLLLLLGARLILPRRGLGWTIVVLGVAGIWVTSTTGFSRFCEQFVLKVPSAIKTDRLAQLKADAKGKNNYAILVLGSGAESFAPEYGVSNLTAFSAERLRYGNYLSRETGIPLAFTGGVGLAAGQGAAEAEIAARMATQDFNRPIKWLEDQSRDTHENATHSIPLLKKAGISHIVLVTHGYHMPRAKRAFEEAAQGQGITIEVAPMGLAQRVEGAALDWFPTGLGYWKSRNDLREMLGLLMGA